MAVDSNPRIITASRRCSSQSWERTFRLGCEASTDCPGGMCFQAATLASSALLQPLLDHPVSRRRRADWGNQPHKHFPEHRRIASSTTIILNSGSFFFNSHTTPRSDALSSRRRHPLPLYTRQTQAPASSHGNPIHITGMDYLPASTILPVGSGSHAAAAPTGHHGFNPYVLCCL